MLKFYESPFHVTHSKKVADKMMRDFDEEIARNIKHKSTKVN